MSAAESKFKSLTEDKLWVTRNPMQAKMIALSTVIEKLTKNLGPKNSKRSSSDNPTTKTSKLFEPKTRRATEEANFWKNPTLLLKV